MNIKLRYHVTRIRVERSSKRDELNNDVWVETESPEQIPVAGWSVPVSDEPKLAGLDRETVEVELIAPIGQFRPRDAVQLPNREDILEVIGEPENFSFSPFGWDPGLEIVNLGGIK